jgi:c-di-GMP-binding flagellar brake protein YcgR
MESFMMNQIGVPAGTEKGKDAHLGIEIGIRLQLQFQGLKEISKTVLVGMERGLYLIVRTPPTPGTWTKLHKENHTVVRYLYKGVVYGFKCTLLGVMNEPFPLLFLSYPTEIETINLRKQERVDCLLPAVARIGDSSYKGVILDISRSGCSFAFTMDTPESSPPVTAGDEVVFAIRFAGSSDEKNLDAKIMNVRRSADKVITGSLFADLGNDALSAVEDYIDSLMGFSAISQA